MTHVQCNTLKRSDTNFRQKWTVNSARERPVWSMTATLVQMTVHFLARFIYEFQGVTLAIKKG